MKHIKLFSGKNKVILEEEINRFIEINTDDVLDLKFNVDSFVIFASLLYEGKVRCHT